MKKGHVIWLTGLPCSGKTTIAQELQHSISCVILDGDQVRKTISSDLSFSLSDRKKHLMRMAHIAKLLSDNGINVVAAFVSPIDEIRKEIKNIVGSKYIEVFVSAPVEECIKRDVKGMWARAKAGEIKEFTGLTSPYNEPTNPDVVCNTTTESVEVSSSKVLSYLNQQGRALYIGRFQPFHDGHRWLIRQSLNDNIPVLVAVRDMLQDGKNPYSSEEVAHNIQSEYQDEDVEVIVIPDIASVNYGRGVGYNIVEHVPPEQIENISATKIRENENRE